MRKLLLITILASFFLISLASAASLSEPTVCCEKTKLDSIGNGVASCINTEQSNCNQDYGVAPANCDNTQFCKLGTCYDSQEGICMDNVPQTKCEETGGTWDERDSVEIPQCQLGCCLIAEQAAFVPLVRCKRMSTLFGTSLNYRTDINNELSCVLEAQGQDKGACVYEEDFEKLCKFTTRDDCSAEEVTEVANTTESTGKKFYKDYLCSAEELGTSCAKQVSTECHAGKVYWVDSCGNRENIYYDGSETRKAKSWNNGKILEGDEVCDPENGNDPNCGNCNYFGGAICGEASTFESKPEVGELKCVRTDCTISEHGEAELKGRDRKNGESWCIDPAELTDKNAAPGSRYFKRTCIDGDVKIEPCADFRNEVCIEETGSNEDVEAFTSAACRVNRWHDCTLQIEEDDCTNIDRRDCKWVPKEALPNGLYLASIASGTGGSFSNPQGSFSNPTYAGGATSSSPGSTSASAGIDKGVCVPAFTPGFNFWETGDAGSICQQASAKCTVKYEKGLLDGDNWDVTENRECLDESWALSANNVCSSLGDCGGSVNYVGDYSDEGYNWIGTTSFSNDPDDVDDQEFTPSGRNTVSRSMSGFVSAPSYVVNDNLKLNGEGYVYVKTA